MVKLVFMKKDAKKVVELMFLVLTGSNKDKHLLDPFILYYFVSIVLQGLKINMDCSVTQLNLLGWHL